MTTGTTLTRSFDVAELLVRADQRTIVGVAVPFGVASTVSDNGGYTSYQESFAPGSFARTIAERGGRVKLLRSHEAANLAVGRASLLREDPGGLWSEFAVSKTTAGDELLELVRDGVVDAFSIGFAGVRDRQQDGVTVRTEVKLYEVSAVNFGAHDGALIAGVRSALRLPADALKDLAMRRLAVAKLRHNLYGE
jgi:HK97 family phage prohead protease